MPIGRIIYTGNHSTGSFTNSSLSSKMYLCDEEPSLNAKNTRNKTDTEEQTILDQVKLLKKVQNT